jgi:hypothetical protein
MASPDRARRQREVAKAVREHRQILPRSYTAKAKAAPGEYAQRVLDGKEPMPAKGAPGFKVLASQASYARWGKANPDFYAAFKQFFYKDAEKESADDEA